VLTVSARGATRAAARATAYEALAHIGLDGGQWRDDVGAAPARAKAEESLWP
jgi:phosphoribosylamine-glycine ligase